MEPSATDVLDWVHKFCRGTSSSRIVCPNRAWDENGIIPGMEVSALLSLARDDARTCWMPDDLNIIDFYLEMSSRLGHLRFMPLLEYHGRESERSLFEKYFRGDLESDERGTFIYFCRRHDNVMAFFIPVSITSRLRAELDIPPYANVPKPQVAELWERLEEKYPDRTGQLLQKALKERKFELEAEYYGAALKDTLSDNQRFEGAIFIRSFLEDKNLDEAMKMDGLARICEHKGELRHEGADVLASASLRDLAEFVRRLGSDQQEVLLDTLAHAARNWKTGEESPYKRLFEITFQPWVRMSDRYGKASLNGWSAPGSPAGKKALDVLLRAPGNGKEQIIAETQISHIAREVVTARTRSIAKKRTAPFAASFGLRAITPRLSRSSSGERGEARLYTQGDDLRDIDWKAFGRSDRLHVFRRADEFQDPVHYLVDAQWLKNGEAPWEIPHHVQNLLKCMSHVPGDLRIYFRGEEILYMRKEEISEIFRKGKPTEVERFVKNMCTLSEAVMKLEETEKLAGVHYVPSRIFRTPPQITSRNTSVILCTPNECAAKNEQAVRSLWKGAVERIEFVLR